MQRVVTKPEGTANGAFPAVENVATKTAIAEVGSQTTSRSVPVYVLPGSTDGSTVRTSPM